MADRQLPELYPGWRTVRKIGSGSFGTVYEIERDLFGSIEKAALKCITIPQNDGDVEEMYSNGYDDASITAHFETYLANIVREYSLMVEMKGHTNVVYCDDIRYVPREDGIGWDITIKMELLTPLIKTLGPDVGEEQVIRLGKDLCRALALCRERDIVHRDIKPQNIFVSKTGDYKLGDFGIAKTVEQTTGGTKIGTYSYMAPEVYHNKPYGSSADIYSLGLVMYWLLNERRLPFLPLPPKSPTYDETEAARHRRFMGEAIPAPKNGSQELKQIVLKACAFEPKDRHVSAQEMLDALEHIGQAEKVVNKVEVQEAPQTLDEKIQAWSRTVPADMTEDKTQGLFFTSRPAAPPEEKKPEPAAAMPAAPQPKAEPVIRAEPAQQEEKTAPVFESKPAPEKKPEQIPVRSEPKPREEPVSRRIQVPKPAPQPVEEPAHGKKALGIFFACAAVVLLLCGVAFYCLYHFWEDPTCQTPATCSLCGKTQGDTVDHLWIVEGYETKCAYCSVRYETPVQEETEPATEAGGDSGETVTVQDVTLKIWAAPEDQADDGSWLNMMLRQFEQDHPEYRVTWDQGYCYEGDMLSMVSADPSAAPDVFLFSHDQLGYLNQYGILSKLEGPYLDQVKKDVPQVYLDTVMGTDGGVYGFPVTSSTWFMYYDKRTFSESDIQSLDRMLDKGVVAFQMQNTWHNVAFFAANGCTIYGPHGNDVAAGVDIGGAPAVGAVKKMLEIRSHPNFRMDDGVSGSEGLRSGTIDAYFSGWWDYAGAYEALGEHLGVAALPTVNIDGQAKQLKAFAGSKAVGVNPNASNHEAAMKLAAFLASVESQLLRFELRGIIPAATALMEHPSVQAAPWALAEMETMRRSALVQPSVIEMTSYWAPMGTFSTTLAQGEVTADNAADLVDALWQQLNPNG